MCYSIYSWNHYYPGSVKYSLKCHSVYLFETAKILRNTLSICKLNNFIKKIQNVKAMLCNKKIRNVKFCKSLSMFWGSTVTSKFWQFQEKKCFFKFWLFVAFKSNCDHFWSFPLFLELLCSTWPTRELLKSKFIKSYIIGLLPQA